MAVTPKDADRRRRLENILGSVADFIRPLLPLANAHMVDFFVKDNWNKLIWPSLRGDLERLHLQCDDDFIDRVFFDPSTLEDDEIAAPELVQLLTFAERNSLPYLLDRCGEDLVADSHTKMARFVADKLVNSGISEKKNNTFMSEKKEHEIPRMALFVSRLAEEAGARLVVDVGSGKGYLGQELASFSSTTTSAKTVFRVVGIEGNSVTAHGAMERKEKMKKRGQALLKSENHAPLLSALGHFKSVATSIDGSAHLADLIQRLRCDGFSADAPPFPQDPAILCGLHTCGGLASVVLRCFAETDCVGLCVVGCCYHLLLEEATSGGESSEFPLSSFLASRGFRIGRNARMLANQPPARSRDLRLPPDISLHLRAVLQVLLHEQYGIEDSTDYRVGKIRPKCSDDFDYLKKALVKLGFPPEKHPDDEKLREVLTRHEGAKSRLFSFFRLRTCLAPVVETLIVLDRLMFLFEAENVSSASVLRLFDPVASPRCYAVVGSK